MQEPKHKANDAAGKYGHEEKHSNGRHQLDGEQNIPPTATSPRGMASQQTDPVMPNGSTSPTLSSAGQGENLRMPRNSDIRVRSI
jgi:hypothetical protein